jgi:glucose/arabinose dehydrogenase
MQQIRVNMIKRFYSLFLTFIFLFSITLHSQNYPAGFSQVAVGNVYYPTSMAKAPDGRIFLTEKAGKVRILKNGVVLSTNFITLSVNQTAERGISSIAIDPDFNTNKYVYVYYTTNTNPIRNRLSRFTANGDVAVAGSEVVLIDFDPVVNAIHNGGGMAFGPDGKLYLGMGEDHVPSNAQDLSNCKGKILRLNKDGSSPADNPFASSSNINTKRIWCYGLRNPWNLSIQPGTGKIFVGDVGESSWEEINDATVAGRNFGWPATEGMTSNTAYRSPVHAYPHGSGNTQGCAISGGAFFNPSSTNYPAQYSGKFFFIDYCNKWINYIDPSGGPATVFAYNLPSSLNSMITGPDGNLYFYSISQSMLYKVVYNGGNAPVITQQPTNKTIPQGQSVSFNVGASGAQPLTYQWQKNSVNISGATSATYTIPNAQPSNQGQYRVVVTNSYGSVTSNNASLTVTSPNTKPVASVLTPSNGTLYKGGDIISFSGNATDAEDGTLAASSFSWIIDFHHAQHIHPGPSIPPGSKTGTFAIPTTGEASANVWYRIKCIVKDSQNQTDTAYTEIFPRTTTITLVSNPPGMQLEFDGQPGTSPMNIVAVENMQFPIGAPSPQVLNGTTYTFTSWSDGGAMNHDLVIPQNNTTYTATFQPGQSSGNCSASGSITREHWSNRFETSLSAVPFNNVAPTYTQQLNLFEGPKNVADNYASRIRGYICPPATGNYTFWIASDNASELYISSNDNPANKVKRAYVNSYTMSKEWTKMASQQSQAIYLVAGQKYYIEAIHLEGGQGDNLAVGWALPNGLMERPIPGNRLSPYVQSGGNLLNVSISSPANNSTFYTPANITINANASGPNPITKVEFYKNSMKIGEDLSAPYSYVWNNVPAGSYMLTAKVIDSQNATAMSQGVNVTVDSAPSCTAVIQPGGPTTFCSGGNVTLYGNTGPGYIYQWKKDGTNITGATGPSYIANTTGEYQLKLVFDGCTTWSAPMKVNVNTSLTAKITPGGPTTFCNGNSVTLYANTCSGYSYQWKKNGADIPGETGNTLLATTSGSYQVKIVQGSSASWSALSVITVSNCNQGAKMAPDDTTVVEKGPLLNDFQITIFPNPTNGQFTFDFCMEDIPEDMLEIRVFSSTGQVVYSKPPVRIKGCYRESIDLDGNLAAGVYILHLKIGNRVESAKLVLSR